MTSIHKKQRINFTATKIISKPAVIKFETKEGKEVSFKAHRDVPVSVRVNFLRRKK